MKVSDRELDFNAVPPESVRMAMRELIGKILRCPTEAIPEALEHLPKPFDNWSNSTFRKIWRAAVQLYRPGEPLDPLDLTQWIDEYDEGGVSLADVADLTDATPVACGADKCAMVISEFFTKRQLANEFRLLALDSLNGKSVDEILDSLSELNDRHRARRSIASGSGLVCRRLSTVKPETVSWLWKGRLPRGKVVVLDGDPGVGKSTLSIDIVARATTGAPFPGDSIAREPQSAMMLTAEDGAGDTIRPRLDAAKGDAERVLVVDGTRTRDGEDAIIFPQDVGRIEEVARREAVAVVVVDPLTAFLDGSVDAHKDADIRRVMRALSKMAERTGATVLAIRHLNKSSSTNAMYRGGGSIAITGAARAAFLMACDPERPDSRILAPIKSNLGPMAQSIRLRLATEADCARIVWEDECDIQAGDLLAPRERTSQRQFAEDFVRECLADGPKPSKELHRMAEELGISKSTYENARKALGVVAEKNGKHWVSRLPME